MSNGLQNKMYNYEVAPPVGVWDKLNATLDESESSFVSSTLFNSEVAPPASVWAKITASLDSAEKKNIPDRVRIFPLLRYAAAAVFIGLIAFGTIRLLTTNKSGIKEVAKNEKPSSAIETGTPPLTETPATTENSTVQNEEIQNDAALEASKHLYAKVNIPAAKKKTVKKYYFDSSEENTEDPASYAQLLTNEENLNNDPANRYVMLMTPKGNIVRMSKKLGDLICCVSGEDENCTDQMQEWRKKIACLATAFSPGNFLDILSLVNSLQEDD